MNERKEGSLFAGGTGDRGVGIPPENPEGEITEEERRFALGIKEKVVGWFTQPYNLRKLMGMSSGVVRAIERSYIRYMDTRTFSNPYYIENIREDEARDEEEIRTWFARRVFDNDVLSPSLLSDAELDFFRQHGLNYQDAQWEKIKEEMENVRKRQLREFEELVEDKRRFNEIAKKFESSAAQKKAREIGIPAEDYLLVLDCRKLGSTFDFSHKPGGAYSDAEEGKIQGLFAAWWNKKIGEKSWRGKVDVALESLSMEEIEKRLRALLSDNPYRAKIVDELGSKLERCGKVERQYDDRLTVVFDSELSLPNLEPVYRSKT